jgi:hypothetical protein
MDEDYEKTFKKCNGMKAVREVACDFEQPHRPASIVEEVATVAASGTAGAGVVVDAVEDANRDGTRDEDDEQLHPPTTSVEEVDTVVASETAGTDISCLMSWRMPIMTKQGMRMMSNPMPYIDCGGGRHGGGKRDIGRRCRG